MYVDLNELRIQRECLCSAKRAIQLLPPSRSPALPLSRSPRLPVPPLLAPISYLLSPLPPRHPFACPPITRTHTYKDHTVRSHRRHHFDCHLLPPSPVCGGPVEWPSPCGSRWRPFSFSSVSQRPLCCCFFDICGVGGGGVSMVLPVFIFLISKTGGWVCESCFSSFRPNKAHPMASCPSSLPLCLSHPRPPLPPSLPPPVCLCLCALCEPSSLLITITVHPPPSW